MIINTSGVNNITIPYNNIYTPQLGNNIYNIPNCVGILGNTMIYQLPNGQYCFRNSTSNIIIPSFITTSVISNIYSNIYLYYFYNIANNPTTYNAAYIDSSGNVYFGYNDNTYTVGMQFLSGSTTINKTGIFPNTITSSNTNTGGVAVFNITYWAQLNNPVGSIMLESGSSSATASAWFVLDGVSSNTVTTTSTSYVPLSCNFTLTDTQMTKHNLQLWLKTSTSSYNAYVEFISFGS